MITLLLLLGSFACLGPPSLPSASPGGRPGTPGLIGEPGIPPGLLAHNQLFEAIARATLTHSTAHTLSAEQAALLLRAFALHGYELAHAPFLKAMWKRAADPTAGRLGRKVLYAAAQASLSVSLRSGQLQRSGQLELGGELPGPSHEFASRLQGVPTRKWGTTRSIAEADLTSPVIVSSRPQRELSMALKRSHCYKS
ncbi:hypothetical protein T492DRAFT_833754 [Pavlovales sp. CCMP2436]|nr:hypothetical protein T492DRAFT_833754 [Pavlovales sp. CCMP2436]